MGHRLLLLSYVVYNQFPKYFTPISARSPILVVTSGDGTFVILRLQWSCCNGVFPSLSRASISTVSWISSQILKNCSTMSWLRNLQILCRGVHPAASTTFGSTPFLSSTSAICTLRRLRRGQTSAVRPFSSTALTSHG
ncbi:unnamed protein product [Trichogramma brassicae]|uniref:Uncharacterized protein n=1 Tax=Trichogramma brassicae TaxID=86971 RepID=A0A6H5HWH5_9HYME|nr:unnamed protein product [Trichogramma brassicae]